MNYWTNLSIEFANQRNYLDELFKVYPINQEGIREIDEKKWLNIEKCFNAQDNVNLIKNLFRLKHFPVKDSYVAYLRKDRTAIERNPNTINRLCGRLYDLGLCEIYEKCSEPIETNQQMGPLFKRWLMNCGLGIKPVKVDDFQKNDDNAILDASDAGMKEWCAKNLNYEGDKGLDFVGRFNKKYVIGEAKFITAIGGHQDRQFDDAILTVKDSSVKAITVAILDGVLYIKSRGKMYKNITKTYSDCNIMSALVLRDFLYSL
jgi:hypothetical protein